MAFLGKPYEPKQLFAAVEQAIATFKARQSEERSVAKRSPVAGLTPRKCETLLAVMAGGTSKSIASDLNISPRTAEMHRARLMDRLGAKSLSEALRIGYEAGLTA